MAVSPPPLQAGKAALDFRLPATDGKTYSLEEVSGENGTVIAFICNHCPYVKAVIDRFVADAEELQSAGIGIAAICCNDAAAYPDDSFDKMAEFAIRHHFCFPYLHDEDQSVARGYGAVCTPDFFGYDGDGRLAYRGRLDEGRIEAPAPDAPRELRQAMLAIARGKGAPTEQVPSMGCSIKWKPSAA